MWFLPSPLNVKVKKFNQAQVNGGSNYDSLSKFLILKFHQKLAFHKFSKIVLKNYDARIWMMVRKWLRLPRDMNNDAIHASISEGGLGIPSILFLSKQLKESRLLNIEGIGTEDDGKALARSSYISKIMQPPYLQNHHIYYNIRIYDHLDTKWIERNRYCPPLQGPGLEEFMKYTGGMISRKLLG